MTQPTDTNHITQPSPRVYTKELVDGLVELAVLYGRPETIGEYMGIRHAIKYIQDTARKYG